MGVGVASVCVCVCVSFSHSFRIGGYMSGVHTEFFAGGGGHVTKFQRHIGIA